MVGSFTTVALTINLNSEFILSLAQRGNIKIHLHQNPVFGVNNNCKIPQARAVPHRQVMQVITPGKNKDAKGPGIRISRFTKMKPFYTYSNLYIKHFDSQVHWLFPTKLIHTSLHSLPLLILI